MMTSHPADEITRRDTMPPGDEVFWPRRSLPWYARVPAPGTTTWHHRRSYDLSLLRRLTNRLRRR